MAISEYNPMLSKYILKKLPTAPGVYLFKAGGKVLYVGKAKNLKNRINSYFQESTALTASKKQMLAEADDIEFIIVSSEQEALLLECNLIKKHLPKYNIILKDDKNFAYFKIDYSNPWPDIFIVHQPDLKNKQARYFGPITSMQKARDILKLIKKIFPICLKPLQKIRQKPKPCFNYLLKRCEGACLGQADKRQYLIMFKEIEKFLKGNLADIIIGLKKEMMKFASQEKFEQAQKIRNQIFALEKIVAKQKMISLKKENQDYVSLVILGSDAVVNVFKVRKGFLVESLNFKLGNIKNQLRQEVLTDFLVQYYAQNQNWPKEVVVKEKIDQIFKNIKIIQAKKGAKRKLLSLGQVNAKHWLNQVGSAEKNSQFVLDELRTIVGSQHKLNRLECFDVSNIQGRHAVGAMSVAQNGVLDKKEYRRFKIQTAKSPDDVKMMLEILSRRFGLGDNEDKLKDKERNWPKPDLIVLDGGKPQFNAVGKLFKKHRINVPLIALAKKNEEIFIPNKKEPVRLAQDSQILHFVQNLRDEAHRFAISYYHLRHSSTNRHSALDEIPSIGLKTKKKLLLKFGSLKNIHSATQDELKEILNSRQIKKLGEYKFHFFNS